MMVGISEQTAGYPMGRFAGRVDTLHERMERTAPIQGYATCAARGQALRGNL